MVKWIIGIIAGILIVCLVLGVAAYFLLRSWFPSEKKLVAGEQATADDYFAEAGWEPLSANIETSLSSVDFVDMNIGWTVGMDGLILKTDDGGVSWQEQSNGTETDLRAIHFFDSDIGWTVGDKGTILRTIDGGETWDELDSTTHRSLYAVHFTDASTGWVVGGGGLYGSDPELTADNQVIISTEDGGDTWIRQNGGSNRALYDVQFVDHNRGWVVGEKGTIISTTDRGLTWHEEHSGTTEDLTSLHFVDSENGWVIGPSFSTGTPAIILKTSDGGNTWQCQWQKKIPPFWQDKIPQTKCSKVSQSSFSGSLSSVKTPAFRFSRKRKLCPRILTVVE